MSARVLLNKLRPNGWDGLVVLAVIALAIGGALAVWGGGVTGTEALTAVVIIDGQEADRFFPAELLERPRTYTGNGYTLTVSMAVDYETHSLSILPPSGEAGIQVAWADCPTQDCVHTGPISRSGQSIICLPGRIVICLEGGPAEDGGVDAVVG